MKKDDTEKKRHEFSQMHNLWKQDVEQHFKLKEPDPIQIRSNEGTKADAGKLRMDLIPPELNVAVSDILTFGATKYGDRNWEKGMDWGRVYGALQRHLNAWWDPNQPDIDEETGKSHLWHAACCIAFLVAYEQRKIGKDDRK